MAASARFTNGLASSARTLLASTRPPSTTQRAVLVRHCAAPRRAFTSSPSLSSSTPGDGETAGGSPSRSVTADVAIIGAGIIGSSIQLELARRGVSSVMVDKGVGAGQGSTSYSSGISRTFYSVLHSVQFSYEGFRVWQQWEDYVGVQDPRGMARLRQCGGLILKSPDAEPLINATLPHHDACGIPYEDWSLSDLKQFYPFLDAGLYGPPKRLDDEKFAVAQPGQDGAPPPQLQGAYFFPLSGYVSDPQLATLNLQYAAECEAGGTLASTLTHAHVQRVMFNNGRVAGLEATTPDGTVQVHAPVVVNAAGPHSSLVNNSVFSDPAAPAANDMKLATKPFRVEVAYLPSPPGFDFSADGTLVMDSDVGTYSRPEVGGKILVGSLEPTCDEEFDVWPETPEQCDYALTDVWTHQVYRFLQRFPTVPLPGASTTQGVTALYDVSDDWTPIYDKSSIPGYYMAIGTSGNQFKNAGVVGALMSSLIDHVESGNPHDAEPLQWKMQRTGMMLDTSKFSRLREPLATSGTVMG